MPISRLPHPILPQCLTPRIYVPPLGICFVMDGVYKLLYATCGLCAWLLPAGSEG